LALIFVFDKTNRTQGLQSSLSTCSFKIRCERRWCNFHHRRLHVVVLVLVVGT